MTQRDNDDVYLERVPCRAGEEVALGHLVVEVVVVDQVVKVDDFVVTGKDVVSTYRVTYVGESVLDTVDQQAYPNTSLSLYKQSSDLRFDNPYFPTFLVLGSKHSTFTFSLPSSELRQTPGPFSVPSQGSLLLEICARFMC